MNRQLLESRARAILWAIDGNARTGRIDSVIEGMLWAAEECARLGDAAEKRYAEVCSKLGRCESGQPSGSDIAREIRAEFGLSEPVASEERRRMEFEAELRSLPPGGERAYSGKALIEGRELSAKFKLPDSHETACGSRIGAPCDCFLGRSGGSVS